MMPVYIIRNETNGLYKIGQARILRERLLALCGTVKAPLRLIWFVNTNRLLRLERAMHARFAESWHHGDWFALTPDQVAEACKVSLVNYKDAPPVTRGGWHAKSPGTTPRLYRIAIGELIEKIPGASLKNPRLLIPPAPKPRKAK
jgi:hypothetical protein